MTAPEAAGSVRLPRITLAPLPRAEVGAVMHLSLPPEQEVFAGPIAELVQDDAADRDFHALWHEGRAAGFFKIERGYGRRHDFAPPEAAGLRMLLIDRVQQGKGLGRALMAALPDYLRATYPGISEVWLTVNCRNDRALRLYLHGGWEDTGQLYHGGPVGPQHVLRLRLR